MTSSTRSPRQASIGGSRQPPSTSSRLGCGVSSSTFWCVVASSTFWCRRRLVDDRHHVQTAEVARGVGHLDDTVIDVVVLQAQRLGHRRVHRIRAGDVGELEDLLVGQMLLQLGEQRVGNAAQLQDEAVGVGEHRPLGRAPAVGHRPGRNRCHLLVAEPHVAHRLAVLAEHELAADGESGAGLAEFAQLGADVAAGVAVELEAGGGVVEGVGDQREHGPPVAGRPRCRAGLRDRVAVPEEHAVDRSSERMGVVLRDLGEAWHVRPPPRQARRASTPDANSRSADRQPATGAPRPGLPRSRACPGTTRP
jgi:hypothetical protein